MKLLIVDDHQLNLKLLRAKLESDGHEVIDAADGVEALEVLQHEAVDGVVSDILMPRMDGYRLCMEIRSSPTLALLPFILYTSTYNSPGDRKLAESLGADAYLAKPAPTEKIVAALQGAVAARSARGGPLPATLSEPAPLMKQYNEVLIRKLEEKGLELERTHEGLVESQARLSGLIASAMDAIIATDANHRIVLFNDAAGRMFGCPREHAIGRPLNDFIPPRLREGHDRHLARFAREEVGARRMGPRDVAALRADGSEFPIEANISRLETSNGPLFTAFIRDVTERRRAEDALQASEAGLRRAQDVARMAHALVDADGALKSCSETLAGLLGVDSPPSRYEEWLEIMHPADRDGGAEASATARRTGKRVDFDYRIFREDEWRRIKHVVEPFHGSDGSMRMFSTFQDITEQRRAEDKIRQLNHVYAVLSGIRGLIVRVADRKDLFEEACRILVDTGHFSKAWIGMVEEGTQSVRFLAGAGATGAYFEELQGRLSTGAYGLMGEVARVLRSGQPFLANDVASDPTVAERIRLVESGSLSLALLPLVMEGRTVGVLSIHAPVTGFFDDEEAKLLLALAGDISFALDHLDKAHRLSYLANHDVLTGLPNRALATELLSRQLAEAGGEGSTCVALLDLVRLRRINETLGRQSGDDLLLQVAGRLRALATSVARVGPDVFLIQMNDCGSAVELAREFEHITTSCFDRPFIVNGEEVRMDCRLGVAVFPGDGDDVESLLRNAEAALRQSKASMKSLVFYAPAMNASASEALAMESRLRRAIEREEFVLYYQPRIRFTDRTICGVEALIRWQDPEHGLVPPMRFVPLLEETGLIGSVGLWALRRALNDLRGWTDAGASPIRVAVNVSPLQLNHGNFVQQLKELLQHGNLGECLELEITESVIMDDVDNKISMLKEIRDLGVNIAVDDFGTGYSSLAYIARLPITSLKIDRSFITDMTIGPEGYILVSSVLALAHALKLKVVAEGVETEEQAQLLKLLACDEAQGYLFSRPVPAEQLHRMLLSGSPLPWPVG